MSEYVPLPHCLHRVTAGGAGPFRHCCHCGAAVETRAAYWDGDSYDETDCEPERLTVELKTCFGEVIFALEGAKTVLEVVKAAVEAKKSLSDADLSDANLSGADLYGADLSGANLRGANLRDAVLSDADLSDADLSDAVLSNAVLSRADLSDADLSDAVLSNAVLSRADLSDANLSGADLSGANLCGANLCGKKVHSLRVFTGLYRYEVWAILFADGERWVRMGCLWKSLEEWERVGIRKSNLSEFPDDGSEKCEERVRAFEFAKDAALRMTLPVQAGEAV